MFRSFSSKLIALSSQANNSCQLRFASSVRPLGPKNKVPSFKGNAVVKGEFQTISHTDYAKKWLIFFFYPLDFTFVCPTEIIAFSDRAKDFQALNTDVVACSCDSHFTHLAWCNTPRKDGGLGELNIPLLSDFNKQIARDFGVLDEDSGLSYRGLFLVDPNGEIRHSVVNDLPVGRSVDEALRVLKAFQFVEKHGEVCPADWQEDQPSINTKSPKEYFSKKNKVGSLGEWENLDVEMLKRIVEDFPGRIQACINAQGRHFE